VTGARALGATHVLVLGLPVVRSPKKLKRNGCRNKIVIGAITLDAMHVEYPLAIVKAQRKTTR